jgi:hypothetical protein
MRSSIGRSQSLIGGHDGIDIAPATIEEEHVLGVDG